jgi:hypothetical protein
MVYDRLATGKPLIITRPASPLAEVDEGGYLGACEWLAPDAAGDIASIVERVQTDAGARERLEFWVERHFGDTTPGEATRRFRAAIKHLIEEWETNDALHAGDRVGSEGDPFDDEDEDEAPGQD